MKLKYFVLSAALMLLAALPAQSQLFFPVVTGQSNIVNVTTVSNYTAYITSRDCYTVSIEERFALMDAGTDDIILHVDGSLNGSTFISDSIGTYTNAATGTTPQTNTVTFDPGANILIRLRLENTSSVILTNAYLAGTVRKSPGGTIAGPTLSGNVTVSSLTASLPVFSDGSKVLVSKSIANTKLALGIQSGTVAMGSATEKSNAFATAFSSTPIVVVTANSNDLPHVLSSSTAGFIVGTAQTNTTVNWIAIGAP